MVGTLDGSFFPLSKLGTKSPHTKFSGRGRGRGRVDMDDFVQSRAKCPTRKLRQLIIEWYQKVMMLCC